MTGKGRGPVEWGLVVEVSAAVVATLDTTPFWSVALRSGERELRLPRDRRAALVRVGAEVDGRVALAVPRARRARRSEHAVQEVVNTYLRLGLAQLAELPETEQPRELLRLLKNAAIHLGGGDIGRPRPQLTRMRGPAISGGLPSLGKRRR